MNMSSLLEIDGLSLQVGTDGPMLVADASLSLQRGEIVGVVGESGSGKTMLGRAIMQLTAPAIRRAAGDIRFMGKSVFAMSQDELRKLRGVGVAMVFQEPMTSLTPSLTIGQQLQEGLQLHFPADVQTHRLAIEAMLGRIGLVARDAVLNAYPHEFSGGMRQRIMIAAAMLLKPALLIADEPTTALDAVIQREVMDLLVALTRESGTAVMLISHDLPMVARYSSRVVVMRRGEVVEAGSTEDVLAAPRHEYSRQLLSTLPQRNPARMPVVDAPLLSVRDVVVDFQPRSRWFSRGDVHRALKGVSLDVHPGEVVAIVGQSGCGKTTLANVIAGLLPPTSGHVQYRGQALDRRAPVFKEYRHQCQMVFQDPYSSLDPRMTIDALVGEPLRLAAGMSRSDKAERIRQTLDDVGLGAAFAKRYPHELSGGQRQRIAIARALVRRPALVVADEAVSALDVTVRAQVLALFASLQRQYGFSCLFISHDLGVVEQIADRVIVMQSGAIVEEATRDALFDSPQHAYTRRLLSAIPILEPTEAGGVRLKWRADTFANAPSTAIPV